MDDLLMLSYVESGMHGADVSTLSICKDQGALLVAATPLPGWVENQHEHLIRAGWRGPYLHILCSLDGTAKQLARSISSCLRRLYFLWSSAGEKQLLLYLNLEWDLVWQR